MVVDVVAVITGCSSSRIFVCVRDVVTKLQREVVLAPL